MSNYYFHHIGKAGITSLKHGVWVWVWNANKIPPHLGISVDGTYYSLKYNGKDEGISVEALFRVVQKERIPTLFIGIDEQLSAEKLIKIFGKYEVASSDGVTCLKPISEIFNAMECRTIFDLLSNLTEEGKVKSVDGICLPEVFEGMPYYNYESVLSRLKELENVKIG